MNIVCAAQQHVFVVVCFFVVGKHMTHHIPDPLERSMKSNHSSGDAWMIVAPSSGWILYARSLVPQNKLILNYTSVLNNSHQTTQIETTSVQLEMVKGAQDMDLWAMGLIDRYNSVLVLFFSHKIDTNHCLSNPSEPFCHDKITDGL